MGDDRIVQPALQFALGSYREMNASIWDAAVVRPLRCALLAEHLGLNTMPRPPRPPASVTAAASAGVLSLPLGACRIGHLRFSLSVNAFADHIRVPSSLVAWVH